MEANDCDAKLYLFRFKMDMMLLASHHKLFVQHIHHLYCKASCGQFEYLLEDENYKNDEAIDPHIRLFLIIRLLYLYKKQLEANSVIYYGERIDDLREKANTLTTQIYTIELSDDVLSTIKPYMIEWYDINICSSNMEKRKGVIFYNSFCVSIFIAFSLSSAVNQTSWSVLTTNPSST